MLAHIGALDFEARDRVFRSFDFCVTADLKGLARQCLTVSGRCSEGSGRGGGRRDNCLFVCLHLCVKVCIRVFVTAWHGTLQARVAPATEDVMRLC